MSSTLKPHAPVCPPLADCKICGTAAPLLGVVDFSKNCEEARGRFLPPSGIPVYYRWCPSCGFLFTNMFDGWSREDFAARIYNAGYVAVDPDYVEARPKGNASRIVKLFGARKSEIACLDYGGGNGILAARLRDAGFARAETFDEFSAEHRAMPAGEFNLVTCFEVFEHVPDPKALVATLARIVRKGGLILFSTLLQPETMSKLKLSWWYIGPRNGHISIYSRKSLRLLLAGFGLRLGSFNSGLHLAFRALPSFAADIIKIKPS